MDTTAVVRQAKLRAGCAERYPTIPARMWTTAAWLAELVTCYRRAQPLPVLKLAPGRTLPEADFEFRGGVPRWLGKWFVHTRSGEHAFSR